MTVDDDLAAVMDLEARFEALVVEALSQWLPVALEAAMPVFAAAAGDEIPPDAEAIEQTQGAWEAIAAAVVLAGIEHAITELVGDQLAKVAEWSTRFLTGAALRLATVPAKVAARVRTALHQHTETVRTQRTVVAELLTVQEWTPYAGVAGRREALQVFNGTRVELAVVDSRETGRAYDKIWHCTHDLRTRDTHWAADLQRVPLNAPFRVGAALLDLPGDPTAPPEERENCRCVVRIVPADSALTASTTGGTMRTFEALLVPAGVIGRSGMFMLGRGAQLLDTVLPMALKWQPAAVSGHEGSVTVGVIEALEMRDDGIHGRGYLLDNEHTMKVVEEIDHQVTRPSAELAVRSETITDAAGNPITMDTAEQMYMDGAQILSCWNAVEMMSAALVSVPEFRDTTITLTESEAPAESSPGLALIAAATNARIVEPHRYPAEFFTNPQLAEPTPIHVNSEGRVLGYLALWDTAHRAFPGLDRTPYHSLNGYADFHQSTAHLDDGSMIRVGRLTVGGGHGPVGKGARAALAHYDDVSTCWALAVVGEDERGIWVSGAIHAQADERMVQLALGTPHSGHWERVGGHPELIAAHAVNSPGFAIYQKAADRDGDLALVASFAPRPNPALTLASAAVLEDVADRAAARAVDAYLERQAALQLAAEADELLAAASRRRKLQADALIRGMQARRKAS